MSCCEVNSMIDRVLTKGVMKIAVALTRPPEEGLSDEFYLDPVTGKPEGVVIDYMKLMAADLGVEPEWVNMPWKDQVDALINEEVDILPKHTNTPERALKIDFADRLISFEVLIVINKDNPQTMESLKEQGRVIACSKGSSNKFLIEKEFPLAKIIEVDEYLLGAEALDKGQVHAWVESPVSTNLLRVKPKLDVIRDAQGVVILSKDYAHPAVKLGDQRSINWMNNWIKFRMAYGILDHLVNVRWQQTLIK
jgi:ABC-type amino acid transport substrate-binding protein